MFNATATNFAIFDLAFELIEKLTKINSCKKLCK